MLTNLLITLGFTAMTRSGSGPIGVRALWCLGPDSTRHLRRPKTAKAIQVGAVIVLWLSGKYDSSGCPARKSRRLIWDSPGNDSLVSASRSGQKSCPLAGRHGHHDAVEAIQAAMPDAPGQHKKDTVLAIANGVLKLSWT